MPKDFIFPDIGEGIHEGKVVKWHANVGDRVIADKTLVEVETDKAVVEIPSPFSGIVIKRNYEEGDIVPVGKVLVQIEEQDEHPATPSPKKSDHQDHSSFISSIAVEPSQNTETTDVTGNSVSELLKIAASPKPLLMSSLSKPTEPIKIPPTQFVQRPDSSSGSGKPETAILATPSTRRLARELGIELTSVRGSGSGGKITDDDVRSWGSAKTMTMSSQLRIEPQPKPESALQNITGPSIPTNLQDERIPLSGMRKVIADRMTYSKTHIPHACGMDFVDVTRLVEIREREKKVLEPKGIKLTYLPFVIKACALALKKFPHINANFDDARNEIVLRKDINISIAVDTPEGLMAPVIKNANQKSVLELAHEIEALATLARERKLKLDDLRGGSFTITNVGSVGGFFSSPIINPPEVAIMGMHRIKDMPLVVESEEGQGEKRKKIEARKVMGISLCFDHRVLDGATATEFMNAIRQYLEDPDMMMLSMT